MVRNNCGQGSNPLQDALYEHFGAQLLAALLNLAGALANWHEDPTRFRWALVRAEAQGAGAILEDWSGLGLTSRALGLAPPWDELVSAVVVFWADQGPRGEEALRVAGERRV